jgi:predicted neutral ceramidase superfamily lipid hydrolase
MIILLFALVISLIDLVVSKMVKNKSMRQDLANIILAFPLLAFFIGFVLTYFNIKNLADS